MAGELKLLWTPLDAPGIDDAAVAASWSRLSILVRDDRGERCLTDVLDRHARTERSEVYGTVLPLAEWVARCWHHLFASRRTAPSRLAQPRERFEWDRSHRWRYCGEGTALPDLEFVRIDDASIELRWLGSSGDEADEFERVLFRTHGSMLVAADELQRSLAEFVDSVIARLDARAAAAPRTAELKGYWRAALDVSDPAFGPAVLASRLGLHWWALDAAQKATVARYVRRRLDPFAASGLELTDIDGFLAWTEEAARLWSQCATTGEAPLAWSELQGEIQRHGEAGTGSGKPWHRGWDACRRLRQVRNVPEDGLLDVDALMAEVGAQQSEIEQPLFKSAIGWSAGQRPLIVRNPTRLAQSRRFATARDLYPLLFSGDGNSDFGCVLSDRLAGLLPVANAFATELIAPIERVRQALGARDRVDTVSITEIAADIGAPDLCVQHQIENHALAEVG